MSEKLIERICTFLSNKKILILGYGKEGQATFQFLEKYGKNMDIYIADRTEKNTKDFPELTYIDHRKCYFGEDYLTNLFQYDVIMKSPGISLKNILTKEIKEKISSQTDLFLQFCENTVIGVTGTKGKSTTSSLIYHILNNSGKSAKLMGNIGISSFSQIENIKEEDIIVYEMSSHQLEYVKHSPNIGILINVYPEHLDHYTSFEAYREAKYNICKYQKEQDIFIVNGDCENIDINEFHNIKSTRYTVYQNQTMNYLNSTYITKDKIVININDECENIYIKDIETTLMGKHNLYNISIVLNVCKILGLTMEEILEQLKTFKGLPHRLEYVGVIDGVKYYNDSIATIPEAAIHSIECFEKVDTLIIGGKDRGINYEAFAKYLAKGEINQVICLPDIGYTVADMVLKRNEDMRHRLYRAENLEEAVIFAKNATLEGGVCLLSPAASSYGFFKNFEERGEMFKELVNSPKVFMNTII